MNRSLALTVFFLLFSLFHFFVDSHLQVNVNYDKIILDDQRVDDSDPINNDHTFKMIKITLISSIFIILSFTKMDIFPFSLIRRKLLLTPVFYQSNYVNVPLLSN